MNMIKGFDDLYIKKINDYYVCFNTAENSKIAIISRQTKKRLDKIKHNREFDSYNESDKETIIKLVNSLVLSVDGAVKQGDNNTQDIFSVWLQLTEKCNLSCPYCTIPKKKSVNLDLLLFRDNIKKLYDHAMNLGFSQFRIVIAGGEPLLEYATVKSVIDICRKINPNVFMFSIVTNGTVLNGEIIDLFTTFNIEANISLDGTSDYHDLTRSYRNGKPSFETVNRNIDRLRENNIHVMISSVINEQNLDGLNGLYDYLYGKNLLFRFNLVRVMYKNKSDIEKDNKKYINAFKKLFAHIKKNIPTRRISRFFLIGNSVFNYGNTLHNHCGILNNFIAYHTNGKYYSCLEGIKDERFRVRFDGNRQILPHCGNITMENIRFDAIDSCKNCSWRYICRGGCPVIKYKSSQRFDVPSERCSFYKAIMPEYVGLIGHQIYHLKNRYSQST